MINKILAILCICLFALVACDQKEPYKDERIPLKLNPPSEKYPEGGYDVNHNGTIYRIPKNYSSDLGHYTDMFNIWMYWPEFVSTKSKPSMRQPGLQARLDTIQLFFARHQDTVAGGIPDNYRRPPWQERMVLYDGPYDSKDHPTYWEYRNRHYNLPAMYRVKDDNVKTPLEEPLIFGCSTHDWVPDYSDGISGSPICSTSVYWPNNVRIHVRFSKKHLGDGIKIYQKVMAFRNSLVIQEGVNYSTPKQGDEK